MTIFFKPGTLAQALWEASQKMEPITPKQQDGNTESSAPRKRIDIVRVASKPPKTKLQKASKRRAIYEWVACQPAPVTVEQLEAHFNFAVRGYLQKMLMTGHLELAE